MHTRKTSLHRLALAGLGSLTALALIAADPDAEYERQSLLSADELHFLIEGLAGPRRQLPDYRFHELFEFGRTPKPVYEKKCDRCSMYHLCLPKTVEKARSINRYLRTEIRE